MAKVNNNIEGQTAEKWDVFISHASEDKTSFVAPLAKVLSDFGIKVWYDEYELKVGDSLSRSIDKGLANSDFGLVVLSKSFFSKAWPERELSGLVSREMLGGKVILPVWHDVTAREVVSYSPPLADKFAVQSNSGSITDVAVKIIKVIRPSLFTRIRRRVARVKAMKKAKTESIEIKDLIKSPIQHLELPEDLVRRIRLVRAALLPVYPLSMDSWLDGFKRDSHPSEEVAFWEHVAAVYLEYIHMTPEVKTIDDCREVYSCVFGMWINEDEALDRLPEKLKKNGPNIIRNLYRYTLPPYDIEDAADEREEFDGLLPKGEDVETFPFDLPAVLIDEIVSKED